MAVLEIPYGTLSESGDFSLGYSRGLSSEAFEALPRVRFEAPEHGVALNSAPPAVPPAGTPWGSAASEIVQAWGGTAAPLF